MKRCSLRDLGFKVGRFRTGKYNSITDVRGVRVGHYTQLKDIKPSDNSQEKICIRTGVTAIVPSFDNNYEKRLVAGGFVLNGIGEITGLTQVMEWGWIETPIMLSNTMSIGIVHQAVIEYMITKYPQLGRKTDVIIPIIGETDDSFLNDVRVSSLTKENVINAIHKAKSGAIPQGSIGAGTGMTTFDFSGGIGSSSRTLPKELGGFTVGVLVLSNLGHMHNLTIDGAVVGRELDGLYPMEFRRRYSYGSIIVVIATDAPLLSNQLSRLAKRAALGVGRTGSFAASTSGEIMIAFSTANKILREEQGRKKYLSINFISDAHINPLYEATIEATEEAIINGIFYSNGIKGRNGHFSPAIPLDKVQKILDKVSNNRFEKNT
jgi:L-aminopeptidase/D-esterase-like protein